MVRKENELEYEIDKRRERIDKLENAGHDEDSEQIMDLRDEMDELDMQRERLRDKRMAYQQKHSIKPTERIWVSESYQINEESQTMKKVRQVIKKKSMMNVDGTKLDLTTASMIASVYDKVNPTNKKRMDSLKLPQLINLTMKVAGKARKESTDLQEMHPKSMDAMKRLNKKTPDAFKDQMPTIGWDAGKQMYRVVMLSKKTGRPVRTSHIPVSREFPAPKDKNKINAKELGKAMKTLEKKIGMKIGVDESTDLPFSLSILERMSGIQNKSTDFIKVPKLNSKQQSYMKKLKKDFQNYQNQLIMKS